MRALAALLLSACAAAAQDLPAQFSVTGVAADDVLNIRAAPDPGAAVLGALPPGTTGVEVVATDPDGRWGMVATGEGNGWVAMRFLARQEPLPGTLPVPFSCLGTEPFWGLFIEGNRVTFSTPDGARPLHLGSVAVADNGWHVTLDDDADGLHALTVLRGQCSDGMSDRRFGMLALFHTGAPGAGTILSGCCTMDGQ